MLLYVVGCTSKALWVVGHQAKRRVTGSAENIAYLAATVAVIDDQAIPRAANLAGASVLSELSRLVGSQAVRASLPTTTPARTSLLPASNAAHESTGVRTPREVYGTAVRADPSLSVSINL